MWGVADDGAGKEGGGLRLVVHGREDLWRCGQDKERSSVSFQSHATESRACWSGRWASEELGKGEQRRAWNKQRRRVAV